MLSTRKLAYNKVYVNSEYRLPQSVSSSDFIIELEEVLETGPNTVMYVIEEAIPQSYYTTQEGFFHYFCLILYNGDGSVNRYVKVDMVNSVYFASALSGAVSSKLNQATNDIQTDLFDFVYDSDSRTMRLLLTNGAYTFKVVTDKEITTTTIWDGNIISEPDSINRLIGNWEIKEKATYWDSSMFNLVPFSSIYVLSPELSDYHYSAPNGYSNCIIKEIPVASNVGGVVVSSSTPLLNDYIDVSNRSFKRLRFKITDARGRVIDFHNQSIELSLLFVNL